jgi:hypothetical protein
MQRIIGFMVVTLIMVIAIGCSSSDNPVTSNSNQVFYRPHTPVAPAIGDRVWDDVNMDGIQGDMNEEPGIAGVTVRLYDCEDTIALAMTTTDEMGYYHFDTLAPGEYQVHFMLPDGYMFSPQNQGDSDTLDSDADTLTGMTVCFTLDSGVIDLSWDAGMYMPYVDPGCTRSKGFWKNHAGLGPQDDWITDLLPILLGHTVADTTIVDTIIVDTVIFDTTIVDTIIIDTTIVDTIIVDTTIADTTVIDTIIVDTTISDTTIVDSTISDTTITDIPISDTTIVEGTGKSIEVTDAQMAVDILHQHTYGHPSNGITKLYAQLLAAKLNIANGASDEDVGDAIADADDFLTEYDWEDWDDLDKDQRMMVLEWKDIFDAYNNGHIGPGYCGDMDEQDEENGDEDNGDMK